MAYEIVDISPIHEGWSRLLVATVRVPDGRTMKREVEDHGAAVTVLPYDPGRRLAVVIRQFRAPLLVAGAAEPILEAPAGILEDEEPAACARREAEEEVGLTLKDLEPVVVAWSMPGISTERAHLFLAAYAQADRTGAGGGLAEEHEDIAILEKPLAELAALADAGRLTDLKLFALVQTLRLRRPELFSGE